MCPPHRSIILSAQVYATAGAFPFSVRPIHTSALEIRLIIYNTNSRFSRVLLTRSASLSIFAPLSPIRLPWRLYQREIGHNTESSRINWCTYNVNGVPSIKNGPELFIGIYFCNIDIIYRPSLDIQYIRIQNFRHQRTLISD